MPNPFVISIPRSGGVLLGGEVTVAIGHVDDSVCGGGEVCLDPGREAAGAVQLQVMVELGAGTVVKGDVVAVGLGIGGKVSVGQGDEGGEIGKVRGDLGGVDRDGLAVRVFIVPQGRRGNSVGRRKRGWREINAVGSGGGDGLGGGAAVAQGGESRFKVPVDGKRAGRSRQDDGLVAGKEVGTAPDGQGGGGGDGAGERSGGEGGVADGGTGKGPSGRSPEAARASEGKCPAHHSDGTVSGGVSPAYRDAVGTVVVERGAGA